MANNERPDEPNSFTMRKLDRQPDPRLWRYVRVLARHIIGVKGGSEVGHDSIRGPVLGYAWQSEELGYHFSLEQALPTTEQNLPKYWLDFYSAGKADRRNTYGFDEKLDFIQKMGDVVLQYAAERANREQELHELQLKKFLESALSPEELMEIKASQGGEQ